MILTNDFCHIIKVISPLIERVTPSETICQMFHQVSLWKP